MQIIEITRTSQIVDVRTQIANNLGVCFGDGEDLSASRSQGRGHGGDRSVPLWTRLVREQRQEEEREKHRHLPPTATTTPLAPSHHIHLDHVVAQSSFIPVSTLRLPPPCTIVTGRKRC